ncbi:Vgb family protein [Leifsonia aquatica]|uniref:Vgb family protein n=1 Tax=Leifsonia aquatica TaxID=144185 RepID=UPI003817DE05
MTARDDLGGDVSVLPVGEPGEGPYAVAATEDGAVWFTLVHGGRVGRRDADGSLTYLALGDGAQPSGIAAATESTVWIADTTGDRLVLVGPGPRILSEIAVPTAGSQPFGVVALDDGTAWFTELGGNALGRVGILGGVDEFPVTPAEAMVSMIAASGDSIWFTMNAADALGHVRGGDAAIAVTDLPAGSGPVGIAVAEDGAVWSALIRADALARVAKDGTVRVIDLDTGAKPHAVAADHDGGVWASLWGANALAHASAAGEVSLHPLPGDVSEPHGLAVAPDGTVWAALESGALVSLNAPER